MKGTETHVEFCSARQWIPLDLWSRRPAARGRRPGRFRRLTPVGLVVAMLLSLVGVQTATGTAAHATINQLHGVNWADPSDNFVTGDLQPVGLSDTDSYATVYAKSTAILKGFQENTGVNYDGNRDGTNDVSFLYALTDTVRKQGMGSILWTGVKNASATQGPGPCENASCAITSLQGTAPNYTLSVTNQSGLDRLQYSWGGAGGGGGTTSGAFHAVGAGKCLDVPGASQTNGTVTQIWDCNGAGNQTWTHTASNQLTVYGGTKCLDAAGNQTAPGTPVQIWDCNGGANQQWTLDTDGTITGAQSGLCLDVTGGSTTDGAKIELWTCTGQSDQQWKLS